MHLPVLEHDYLGIALPSLHSSALHHADIPFCQVKQAQNCVKKPPVFPVQFISAYKEKYCKCSVFLCFLAVTHQNNSPKQVPGIPLCLELPTGLCPNSCFKRKQQDPLAQKCLLSHALPMPSVGKREFSCGSLHPEPSAAGDGPVQHWTVIPEQLSLNYPLSPNPYNFWSWTNALPSPPLSPGQLWSHPGAQSSAVPASSEGWRGALWAARWFGACPWAEIQQRLCRHSSLGTQSSIRRTLSCVSPVQQE